MGDIDKEQTYIKEFGKSLKSLRINVAQKSLRIFAYETDVPCATLSRIENGQRIANLVVLKKIASGFDWNVSELISRIERDIPDNVSFFDL